MLKVESIDVAYGEIRALKGVALEVGQGEIVTILGNNGAGKTTTLKTISGLLHPTRGAITLEDESLLDVPPGRGESHVQRGRLEAPTALVGVAVAGLVEGVAGLFDPVLLAEEIVI